MKPNIITTSRLVKLLDKHAIYCICINVLVSHHCINHMTIRCCASCSDPVYSTDST